MEQGTSQLTREGITRHIKSVNCSLPFCHTISVVTSPKGLKAPPALLATTMLMQQKDTYFGSAAPT
eukprot:1178270-Prorocentrum_minimum.AAC.2